MPDWDYQSPYPKNPKPPSVSLPRNVKVGDADGSDVTAYKRAVSRGGRWPWQAFDDTYSKSFANGKDGGNVGDSGVRGFQRQSNLDDDGEIGPNTFEALRTALVPDGLPNAGQPLFDNPAIQMLKEAASNPPSGGGGSGSLVQYAKDSINNEPRIHYSQNRPMTHLGVPPAEGFTCDCSGHSTGCYYEAGWPDPNGMGYNGSGYTGTLINNPKVTGASFQVGDLAIYGTSPSNTTHVVTCFQAGNNSTSRWVSHGSEAGPYSVQLYYRSDLVAVVRPPK
jgi:hypothetical protein